MVFINVLIHTLPHTHTYACTCPPAPCPSAPPIGRIKAPVARSRLELLSPGAQQERSQDVCSLGYATLGDLGSYIWSRARCFAMVRLRSR